MKTLIDTWTVYDFEGDVPSLISKLQALKDQCTGRVVIEVGQARYMDESEAPCLKIYEVTS